MFENLNMRGLTKNANSDNPITVSQTYNLITEGSNITHSWQGDMIKIKRPAGLSNLNSVKFRSFRGEMLPFTRMDLPELKCAVNIHRFDLNSVTVKGESTVYGGEECTGELFNFSKAWTYEESEESQVINNINECIKEANRRIKMIYPYRGFTYVFGDPSFHDIVNKDVCFPRSDAGSGCVGFINDPNGKKFRLYTGETPFSYKEITLTNNLASTENRYITQLYSNHNNSIVFSVYSNYRASDGNYNRAEVILNPGTETETHIKATANNYMYNDALCPPQTEAQGGGVEGASRMMNCIFATVTTDGTTKSEAVLWSPLYTLVSAAFGKMNIVINADTTYNVEIVGLNTWLDNNYTWSQGYPTGPRYDFHPLAFTTRLDNGTLYLYIFGAFPWPNRFYQSDPEHSAGNLVDFYLFRCELNLSNNTSSNFTCIASKTGVDHNMFKLSLMMLYQYGADIGESLIELDGDAIGRSYINFGFKYVVRWKEFRDEEEEPGYPELQYKVINSSLWDYSSDLGELVYLVRCGDSNFQSFTGLQQAFNAGQAPAAIYNNGFTPYTGAEIVDGLHLYRCLWNSGKAVAWFRNVSDEGYIFNWDILNNFNNYTLGGEDDAVRNITEEYTINMKETSDPLTKIYQGYNDYATISPDNIEADYITGSFSISDVLSGSITTPTLILYDDTTNPYTYYQVLFSVRIWTEPYYFDIYNSLTELNDPSQSFYSFDLTPRDAVFNQINTHVLRTLEALITMKYEFNDLILKCSTFPNIDNVVFSINESAYIDFKVMGVDSTVSELIITVEDQEGNKIDRDTLTSLYGALNLSIDWEG